MTTTWTTEESALADLKNRLEKLRVEQSRQQKLEEEAKPVEKDTLKILQSKFGSMVYDPTSPLQNAYERQCARAGRRMSIEFEDLYQAKGSGRLHHPSVIPGSPSHPAGSPRIGSPTHRIGSAAPRKHPLLRSSSGMDHSHHLGGGHSGDHKQIRYRKSSDPSSYYKRADYSHGNGHHNRAAKHGAHDLGGHGLHKGHSEQEGHKGHGQKGVLGVSLSQEDKHMIDQKLSGIEDAKHQSQQPRRRKISLPSKSGTKPREAMVD